jgi:hypothetical protein
LEVTNSTNLIFTQPHWERKRTGGEVGISIKKVSSKSLNKFQDATGRYRTKNQEPGTRSKEARGKRQKKYTVN